MLSVTKKRVESVKEKQGCRTELQRISGKTQKLKNQLAEFDGLKAEIEDVKRALKDICTRLTVRSRSLLILDNELTVVSVD